MLRLLHQTRNAPRSTSVGSLHGQHRHFQLEVPVALTGRVLLHSNSVQGLLAKAIGTLGDVPDRLLQSGRNTSDFFCNKTYVYKEGADSDDDDNDESDDDDEDTDEDHEIEDDDSDRNEDGEDAQTDDGARRRRGRRRPCVRVFQPVVRSNEKSLCLIFRSTSLRP